jgi:hypothetical protein
MRCLIGLWSCRLRLAVLLARCGWLRLRLWLRSWAVVRR